MAAIYMSGVTHADLVTADSILHFFNVLNISLELKFKMRICKDLILLYILLIRNTLTNTWKQIPIMIFLN